MLHLCWERKLRVGDTRSTVGVRDGLFSRCLDSVAGGGSWMGTVCPYVICLSMLYKQVDYVTQFSPEPVRNPLSSDTAKPFLSLWLFTGTFPFIGELVLPHHIYCLQLAFYIPSWANGISGAKPWLPLFEEQVEASRNRGFAHLSPSDAPALCNREWPRCTTEMWGEVCKNGHERGNVASVSALRSQQCDEMLASVPPNSFL